MDGKKIPLQVDVKAKHADTSIRHAIITAKIPKLSRKSSETIILKKGIEYSSPTSVSLEKLLSKGFDAELIFTIGKKKYTSSARKLLQTGSYETWLSGPEVSEWVIGGSVKSSGEEHPHLAAYFHVRAYAGLDNIRIDVVVENGWALEPNPKDINYSASLKINGNDFELPFKDTLTHYHHTRWHKQFWLGEGEYIYVKHDSSYLQASKAVSNYDNVRITNKYLNELGSKTFKPMHNGDLTKYFGQTGAQDQIGPLPRWTTTYVLTTKSRAFNAMLVNDDHAGSYAAHYRDKRTGKPVSIKDHPLLTIHDINGVITTPKAKGNNPYSLDIAHQPSLAYVSYMVTGDYYYLEEMQFWASWNHLWTNPISRRQKDKGIFLGQVRGQAWALRNLGQVAFITPDNHPYKEFLNKSLINNLEFNEMKYSKNPNANALGTMDTDRKSGRPWMDDFYTWVMGYLVELGFERARSMRDWKVKYVIQRIGENQAYCWQFATKYEDILGPGKKGWYKNFDEYWEVNWGNIVIDGKALRDVPCGTSEMTRWLSAYSNKSYYDNEMVKDIRPHSPDSYYAYMQPAVAITVDSGLKGSALAGKRFYEITTVRPDYTDNPQWAVVPRESLPKIQ